MNRLIGYLFLFIGLSIGFTDVNAQQRSSDMQLGTEYFRNREYKKALPIFENLYQQNPSQAAYHYYFSCLIELGDFKKAERTAKQQIRKKPGNKR